MMFPTRAAARGNVVVVHGLNTKPDVMDESINVLNRARFNCYRVSLYDVESSVFDDPASIIAAWVGAVEKATVELTRRAPKLPLFAVSYSLGSLVTLRCIERNVSQFSRVVLWAPPLALTPTASMVRLLIPLRRLGLCLPSAAPRSIRQRPGTPVSEYAALLHMTAATAKTPETVWKSVPALLILDEKDELVSAGRVRAWVERRSLHNWTVHTLSHRASTTRSYRHFVVSESALGAATWERASTAMIQHLTTSLVGQGAA